MAWVSHMHLPVQKEEHNMNRSLSLLLASLLLVFVLTACGRTNNQQDNTAAENGNAVTGTDTTDNGALNNGTTGNNNAANDHNTVGNDLSNAGNAVVDGVEDVGDAVRDGANDVGNALTGNNANSTRSTGNTRAGAAYDQMI